MFVCGACRTEANRTAAGATDFCVYSASWDSVRAGQDCQTTTYIFILHKVSYRCYNSQTFLQIEVKRGISCRELLSICAATVADKAIKSLTFALGE